MEENILNETSLTWEMLVYSCHWAACTISVTLSNTENWAWKKPGIYKWIILWVLVVLSFTDWKDISSDSRALFKNLPFFHSYFLRVLLSSDWQKGKKVLNIHGLTLIRGICVSTSGSSIFGIRAVPGVCFTGCLSQPSSTSTGIFPHFWCWGNSHTTFVSLHLGLSDWRVLKSWREVYRDLTSGGGSRHPLV